MISVIIPFFNRLEWTHDAVESVLQQTYTDFEIILIDDGSIHDYKEKFGIIDNRIKYFRQGNKGRSTARNFGIRMARGKYITFLDSDDLYSPVKLEKQIQIFESNPNFEIVYTNFYVINEVSEILPKYGNANFVLSGNIYPDLLFIKGANITTPSVMVKKELLNKVGGFDEKMNICEDLDLWRRIARIAPFFQIREAYVFVRYRDRQDSFWKLTKGRTAYYKKAILDDPSLSPIVKKSIYVDMFRTYFKWSLRKFNFIFAIYAYLNLLRLDFGEALSVVIEIISKIWRKLFSL